ncbi:initiation factor 2B related protein [Reticulomyxa filosa]|uniref:Initiation factor 2B related protein n=1 Tax=Reticulomyxa filosa TaxID=46433 RepID=X6N7R9_RETFI|nr:initiation factor 2B related protein [Reticulomyxa filosa]|eukprot:ETO22330.1 initiation factor 2B related protein [Reticulomyxa filosa]
MKDQSKIDQKNENNKILETLKKKQATFESFSSYSIFKLFISITKFSCFISCAMRNKDQHLFRGNEKKIFKFGGPVCSTFMTAVSLSHIVIAFVVKEPSKIPNEILFLQQSAKMDECPKCWCGIEVDVSEKELSDNSYLEKVLISIIECTCLKRENLLISQTGRPLRLYGERKNVLLHPQLFHLRSLHDTICLNEKYMDYKWLTINEKIWSEMEWVPFTQNALGTVLFDPVEQSQINWLKADRKHGASQLAIKCLEFLQENYGTKKESMSPVHVYNYCYQLFKSRSSMQPVANVVITFLEKWNAREEDNTPQSVAKVCKSIIDEWSGDVDIRIPMMFHKLLCSRHENHKKLKLFTLSISSNVYKALNFVSSEKHSHNKYTIDEIVIAESRPLFEGVSMAEKIENENVSVTIITEAQMGIFIPLCDAIVFGVDTIDLRNGYVINKVGKRYENDREQGEAKMYFVFCYLLLHIFYLLWNLSVLKNNVPVYVIGHESKLRRSNTDVTKEWPNLEEKRLLDQTKINNEEKSTEDQRNVELEEMDEGEITKDWASNIKTKRKNCQIRNIYFEKIPLLLIDALVLTNQIIEQNKN